CNGASDGSVSAIAGGGTAAYSFVWNTSPNQNTANATGLAAGAYIVMVTDANGCSATQSQIITAPTTITVSGVSTNAFCTNPNGMISTATGGGTSPYTYLWSNNETTSNINQLNAGNYSLTVTDTNGCTKTLSETVG